VIDILAGLDRTRRAAGTPGLVTRETAPDGSECRIVHVDCSPDELDDVIVAEVRRADAAGYTLEWKTYEHDRLPGIADRLVAAGFEPDAVECVLVAEVGAVGFDSPVVDIRQVRDAVGLADVAAIAVEMGRNNVEDEVRLLAAVLRDTPERMSVHVAYVDGLPVACGRIYFPPGSPFAELAGGGPGPPTATGVCSPLWSPRGCGKPGRGAARMCSWTRCPLRSRFCVSGGSSS
jgi:hypothetical protein